MLASAKAALGLLCAGVAGPSAVMAYKSRPTPDPVTGELFKGTPCGDGWRTNGQMKWKDGTYKFLGAARDSLPLRCSRVAVIVAVTGLSKLVLTVLNDLRFTGDKKHLDFFMDQVLNREKGVPLITVANHTSMIDDPALMSCIVGWRPVFLDKHRWGVCTQDICFKNSFTSSFCGVGKAMPINRGAGIDQPLMANLAQKICLGDWLHMYPEAKIFQTGKLGRGMLVNARSEERVAEIGTLKWGVGKLVAHSPTKPVVIPHYHIGMHQIIPQNNTPTDNSSISLLRAWFGFKIFVRFGPPIEFGDLVAAYEEQHGPLRKMEFDEHTNTLENWGPSTRAEQELYSAITRRVEETLLALEEASQQETSLCWWAPYAWVKGAGTLQGIKGVAPMVSREDA